VHTGWCGDIAFFGFYWLSKEANGVEVHTGWCGDFAFLGFTGFQKKRTELRCASVAISLFWVLLAFKRSERS
jgi:hypothetical protein